MSSKRTGRATGEKGQSLVETALVLPIIILILTAIIDFGFVFNNYLIVSSASREGARSAVVGYNDTEIRQIISSITSTLDSTKLTISISPSQASRDPGDEVTITVEYKNSLMTPVISSILPNPLEIKGKTVMRME